ncbi:MAG: glutamine--tRNA ligase/YqeY domain fusion protein [Verrucomicrobiota bacterium]|nr:glutamine--tRNA ligase/YqeY domain fusion protein [Verrucomicrobiota bacterium]
MSNPADPSKSSAAKSAAPANASAKEAAAPAEHFIRQIVREDLEAGRISANGVITRFPPEPNGYLHIGHAKAICIDFGVAKEFGGRCHLRFDDTNPVKEDVEYVDSIMEDIRWLGFDWGEHLYYASDYFGKLYECAEHLIGKGLAFVCDLTADEMRTYRGTLTESGRESPFRNRSVAENLDLFRRMKAGEFPVGTRTLRAKIDMNSPNIVLRDPVIYRNIFVEHHRTGNAWCLYPMYDFAHPLSDAIEGITHSLCSLEYVIHRPLYDWCVEHCRELLTATPHQYEFARLNLNYMVMSKRKLLQLVNEKRVRGWDDPRMPTICGMRRRGYTAAAIRDFCERVGVAKRDNVIDFALLEHCVRADHEATAPRALGVVRPLKVVIDNYPEGQTEEFDCPYHSTDASLGSRKVPFGRVLYIEQDDFRETPPPKYFRLFPGNEVRLRWAYFVKCTSCVKDPVSGEVTEVHCTYDPASRGGNSPDGRKVKGTIHWVSAEHALKAETRLYDHLFTQPAPEDLPEGQTFLDVINPASENVVTALVEPSLATAKPGTTFQFERVGYFTVDSRDSTPGAPVFNRTVSLKDSFGKQL